MSNIHPITFSLTNILKIISFMSPFLFSLTIILYAILANKIVKGLILLIGIVIVTFINYLLKNIIKSKQNYSASPFCNILPSPFTYRSNESIFDSPSLSITILTFISTYLIFPMFTNNDINYSIIIFALIFICCNGAVEYNDKCSNYGGIILGFIVGIILGILYYNLIVSSGYKDIAYFNQVISDNTQCTKPGPTKFRCKKYVRGIRDSSNNYVPLTPDDKDSDNQFSLSASELSNYPLNIVPVYANQSDISGKFYIINTPMAGTAGEAYATHMGKLLKCGDLIKDSSYQFFPILKGHKNSDRSKHHQFIVDCCNSDFYNFYLTNDTANNIWIDHSNVMPEIMVDISNRGGPQPYLDVLQLYYFDQITGEQRPNQNFYMIPGANDMSVCDALSNKIGCGSCLDIASMFNGSSEYNIQANLIFNDPLNRANSFSRYTSSALFGKYSTINDKARKAGWGLTACSDNPQGNKGGIYVRTHPINLQESVTVGSGAPLNSNRYAYWLNPFSS